MMLLPKFLGISVFDQANQGAQEAHAELQNPGKLDFVGPTADNSVAGQIDFVTNAPAGGYDVVMLSNNAGDQIDPAVAAAHEAGTKVVTWDSPIPSGKGEALFVAQVDFDETGKVMADMALDILGEDGRQVRHPVGFAGCRRTRMPGSRRSRRRSKDPEYANLELLDIVYGNDQSEESYNQALALVDKYPEMELIMAPTSVGIVAAAKAMQDEGLCDTVKVSGLGLPEEMIESYLENGCAPEFALWSFVDLGYLTYYASYLLATGAIQGVEGESFDGGPHGHVHDRARTRPGRTPARCAIVMGPFSVYNEDNPGVSSRGNPGQLTAAVAVHTRNRSRDARRRVPAFSCPSKRNAGTWHALTTPGDEAGRFL